MGAPAILGTGSAVPAGIRKNDDPIFTWIHQTPPPNSDLFAGYRERRVLGPNEDLGGLMIQAATNALGAAGVVAGEIDLVLGYASFGQWAMPNDLVTMAAKLGVPSTAMIMPINSEYANFEHGLLTAEGLISTGRASSALIVVGADWTRYVDYRTPPCVSAGDGAGAEVMGASDDGTLWRIKDVAVAAERQYLGGMYVKADPTEPPTPPAPQTWGPPLFHFDPILGGEGFKNFGMPVPPQLVEEVLARNGLTPADIAFIGHQTTIVLNKVWQAALKPGIFVETLKTYANMTAASIPVNFDVWAKKITTDHVALVGLGPEPSCTVVLLSRNGA